MGSSDEGRIVGVLDEKASKLSGWRLDEGGGGGGGGGDRRVKLLRLRIALPTFKLSPQTVSVNRILRD